MHIGEALEGALLGREQPVDGPVGIHLLVVLPEVLDKVILNGLPKGIFNEVKVLIEEGFSEDLADEFDHAVIGVVIERTIPAEEWDNAVIINLELLSLEIVGLNVCCRRIRIGNVQARTVQAVAAHHTANGV